MLLSSVYPIKAVGWDVAGVSSFGLKSPSRQAKTQNNYTLYIVFYKLLICKSCI